MAELLSIENLTVGYRTRAGWRDAVRDVSLRVASGTTYGIVGESGSGKTTLALAALRYLGEEGAIRGGRVLLDGHDMAGLSPRELQEVWGRRLRLVPQNPLGALNPSLRVGTQLVEALDRDLPQAVARRHALDLLSHVRMADPERVFAAFPHELSGGMQQRVMIAMALHGRPDLLVLDEPTTNLDVTTEATILDLLDELIVEQRTAALFVSHNLGVIARVADRVAVLYAGELVEDAPVMELFAAPRHPYTLGLLASVPRPGSRHDQRPLQPISGNIPRLTALPSGCVFAPRCPLAIERCHREHPPLEMPMPGRQVRCFRWEEVALQETGDRRQETRGQGGKETGDTRGSNLQAEAETRDGLSLLSLDRVSKHFPLRRDLREILRGAPRRVARAVDGVALHAGRGRTLGIVGESGSGKTTLARCVIGLSERSGGAISLLDLPLAPGLAGRPTELLSRIQMVFQNPEEALNPYLTVGETLRRPLMRLAGQSRNEVDCSVTRLLEAVKLSADYAERLPGQLSGGEKQRVAIARAFASAPDLVIFDEAVSALDVSVQAAILNLLSDLQQRNQTTYLFITHDLGVVRYLADDVAVVYLGQVVEQGPVDAVLRPPFHPYTEALLSAVPAPDPTVATSPIRLEGEVPSPSAIPTGCRFHTRCPRFLGEICRSTEPPWREAAPGHRYLCHIPPEELWVMQGGEA